MNILEATPAEIDIEIRRINLALAEVVGRIATVSTLIDRWDRSIYNDEATIAVFRVELDGLITRRGELLAERKPLDTEFERRDGWTRYHYVTNRSGHIHWTRDCHTCQDTTPFWFLAEQSGMPFEELEKLAGEKACTVCFPGAPVDRSAQLTHPEQDAKDKAAADRAAKQAAAAAKVLRTPEGKPVYTTTVIYKMGKQIGIGRGQEIKSEATAISRAVDILVSASLYEQDLTEDNLDGYAARTTWDALVAAIAHRRGVDTTVVSEEIRTKADKKIAARKREWDKGV